MEHYDVIIVGGGLAGLTAGLHLRLKGHAVLLIERKPYPHHKVCGEYVSNEVVPYLGRLGISLMQNGAVAINRLEMSTGSGDLLSTPLALGGKGISRYAFDHLLYQKARSAGTNFAFRSVTDIHFKNDGFEVHIDENEVYTAKLVIGAYGKRSNLDKQLDRDFFKQKSSWLGVKAHYRNDDFPDDLVALHNFNGGYGGLSKTESGAVNFCYLAHYQSFQKEKGIENFNQNVVSQNPFLKAFLENAEPLFEIPLTIAQISFRPKKSVENHILMCGDTASLIHPLCGNGMAMAIHSAKIASERIHEYLSNTSYRRDRLEQDYQKQWKHTFQRRLWVGRRLQSLLLNRSLSKKALAVCVKSPFLLQKLIKTTHGSPIS